MSGFNLRKTIGGSLAVKSYLNLSVVFFLIFVFIVFVLSFFTGFFCLIRLFFELVMLIDIFFIILFFSMCDRAEPFRTPKMNFKSRLLAYRLKCIFTPGILVNFLNLGQRLNSGLFLVPNVEVFISEDRSSGYVALENLANYKDLSTLHINQNISSILNGSFAKYVIVSNFLTEDGLYMIFNFENIRVDNRLVIRNDNLSKFKSENANEIIVQNDLILKFGVDVHHLVIIARTRSGKTFFAGRYLANLMSLQGWIVEYNSAKYDKYVKCFAGQSEPEKIVIRAEYWVEFMNQRLVQLNANGCEKYQDFDLVDVAIFFDELGNLNAGLELDKKLKARWQAAINKLTATGASAGIHIIAISQMASLDGLGLPSLARVNLADSVIMLGAAANSADERRFLLPGFADLPSAHYDVGCGICRFVLKTDKWANPHKIECPRFDD